MLHLRADVLVELAEVLLAASQQQSAEHASSAAARLYTLKGNIVSAEQLRYCAGLDHPDDPSGSEDERNRRPDWRQRLLRHRHRPGRWRHGYPSPSPP
jgi:hypothetical protein